MAKGRYSNRRSRRRKNGSFTIPIAATLPILSLGVGTWNEAKQTGWVRALEVAQSYLTGYDVAGHNFDPGLMKNGLLPIFLGGVAHKVIGGGLGVNRALGKAKIPVVRI